MLKDMNISLVTSHVPSIHSFVTMNTFGKGTFLLKHPVVVVAAAAATAAAAAVVVVPAAQTAIGVRDIMLNLHLIDGVQSSC